MNHVNLDVLVVTAAFVLTSSGAPTATSSTLADLGGELCEDSAFTCVTLDLPVNHFDPTDDRTLAVTFAVLPASGARQGAFVVAVGGPGGSGLEEADWRFEDFGPMIRERFDIVFFDQRGVDLGEELTCPDTNELSGDTWSQLPDDLPERWDPLVEATSAFVKDCVAEMPRGDLLPFLGTAQAAADLEAFRDAMGYDRLVLLRGELRDPVRPGLRRRLSPTRLSASSSMGRSTRLSTTTRRKNWTSRRWTSSWAWCSKPAISTSIAPPIWGCPPPRRTGSWKPNSKKGPATVMLPTGDGGTEEATLAAEDLGNVAFSNIYMESDRMVFLGPWRPMPAGMTWSPSSASTRSTGGATSPMPSTSRSPASTLPCPETPRKKKPTGFGRLPKQRNPPNAGPMNRLWIVFSGPASTTARTRSTPFVGTGIPTLVIATEADPTTPYVSGLAVYEPSGRRLPHRRHRWIPRHVRTRIGLYR